MLPWIVFIALAILAAIPSGRYTAKYAAQGGGRRALGTFWVPCFFRSFLSRGWSWDCCRESKAASVGGLFVILISPSVLAAPDWLICQAPRGGLCTGVVHRLNRPVAVPGKPNGC